MTMTKVELNEKNMATINSILEKGFRYHNEDDQPKNINQVIARLIELVHYEDYLKEETSDEDLMKEHIFEEHAEEIINKAIQSHFQKPSKANQLSTLEDSISKGE